MDFFFGRLFGLGLVGAWRLWPLGGPGTCCFLGPYLGFFPLASSVGRWLGVVEVSPWWSSLRSFAMEVVTLVLCQVFVGLPLCRCCASGLLGPVCVPALPVRSPISGPVCVLPQSTIVTLLSLLWMGLFLGLRAVPLPQADAMGFGLRCSAWLSGLLTGRC